MIIVAVDDTIVSRKTYLKNFLPIVEIYPSLSYGMKNEDKIESDTRRSPMRGQADAPHFAGPGLLALVWSPLILSIIS